MNLLELLDLNVPPQLFVAVSWLGAVLCGVAAATTVDRKCAIPHWLYMISFLAMAFALIWATVYGNDRQWVSWPPHFMLVCALNVFLTLRIIRYSVMFRRAKGYLPFWSDGKVVEPNEIAH